MPSPKDDPYVLNIWQELEKKYIDEGLSRWGAVERIALEYSVSPQTVYKWLTPGYRSQKNKLMMSEEYKKKKREWARRPENKIRLYEYSRKYTRYRRHLDSYVEDLFLESGGKPMTLLSISEKLKEKTDVRFDKKLVLSAISKYNSEHENNPIEEIEPDLYRMKL